MTEDATGSSTPLVQPAITSKVKMRQFLVLMWKHFTVRKTKFIATPVELLAPCFFFIILCFLRSTINPKPHHEEALKATNLTEYWKRSVQNTEIINLDKFQKPELILYSPDSPLVNSLMKEVGAKLGLKKLDSFPTWHSQGYYAFSDEALPAINNFTKDVRDNTAIVLFQGLEQETWPQRLNYTIRMKRDFLTNVYQAVEEEQSGVHPRFGTMYEPFVSLQWAIDTSYLTLLSGDVVIPNVSFQEFPFVEQYSTQSLKIIVAVLKVVCAYSLLLPFVFLLTRLLEERATGVQELIRMVGVSNATLYASHFVNALPVGLVYAVCGAAVVTATASPYIPNTNAFLIFLMLLLYFCSIVALAFACSFLTKTTQYATTLSVVCFLVLWQPTRVLDGLAIPRVLLPLTGLLPHVPMNWFWTEVDMLERPGGALDFTTMWTSHSRSSMSGFLALVMLCVQTVLFAALGWYLSMIFPGKYGVGLPWNFLLQKSYWARKRVDPEPIDEAECEEDPMTDKDARYFEDYNENEAPSDVGIRIANVYKVFGRDTALANVSLDVYRGEITVLLGHNGAGKTTLMSIITGMTSATSGQVLVNGLDVSRHQGELRRQLGLCPQHNLFFPDLTVIQHLMFFAMLKGSTHSEAYKSSMELLNQLGLDGKADSTSGALSGGMQRRLQLACALSGGASVLVLDEPTSGLDVETRRELWDLLLSLRGSRTVLLTTHFMEEADALGDRVAALHKGRLRCHATPIYLKRSIGTGYRLSMTTIGLPRTEQVSALIASVLPGAVLKDSSYNSLAYNLPSDQTHKFPQLFEQLEANRSQLGVDSIGVGVSSLEDVFLKLCSDTDANFAQEAVDNSDAEPTFKRIGGCRLYARQFAVLARRQLRYILHKKMSFAMLQIFLPLLSIYLFTYILNEAPMFDSDLDRDIEMNLDIYKEMRGGKALYSVGQNQAQALDKFIEQYKHITFAESSDIANTVLKAAEDVDQSKYYKYLVGIEINATHAKVLYTTTVRHAAPVALNFLSNLVAGQLPWADARTLTARNHPLSVNRLRIPTARIKEPKDMTATVFWTVIFVSILTGALMNSVSLPISELASGTRHIHVLSGCPGALLWLATLMSHLLLYTVLLLLPAVGCVALDKAHTLDQASFVGPLLVILVVGSAAFLSFCYLVSFHFQERGAGLFLSVAVIFLGIVPAMVKHMTYLLQGDLGGWRFPVNFANAVFPIATLPLAVLKATNVARANAYCALNLDKCPNLPPMFPNLDVDECCALKRGTACILCMEETGAGLELIVLTIQLVAYMTLVILTQYGVFNVLYERLVNARYRPRAERCGDDMVRAEHTYVSKGITLPPKQIPDAMLVHDLHKNYFSCLKPRSPCNAVKGISFSLKKGECFGLLGVNGAGKSTTFKMITGEECPTRGGVFANGHHMQWPRNNYLQSLGYCPQAFGLDEFLTGRENLALLLTLRGLQPSDVSGETDAWIQVVGLEKYRDRLVSGYSGGCKRRLGTAAALCSGAAVTLLDEPTAGVDVSARRRVWMALRRGLRAHRAVVITSHSMDEMEALCDRIAIMSGGRVGALGSAGALRAAHAAGHALVLKIKPHAAHYTHSDGVGDEDVDSAMSGLNSLKASLKEKFNCSLKDEHKSMLHYHINETLRYSALFAALEQLRAEHPRLLEDYSVTETTLEEVFLSFAAPRNPPPEPAAVPV